MLLKNLINIIFILTMLYTSVPLFSVRKWCALMIWSNCFLQDINKKKYGWGEKITEKSCTDTALHGALSSSDKMQ